MSIPIISIFLRHVSNSSLLHRTIRKEKELKNNSKKLTKQLQEYEDILPLA
jgi:hypothetical protein